MKKYIIFIALLCTLALGAFALGSFLHKDCTGMPYEEIAALQEEKPYLHITYTVTIEGGEEPLLLNQDSTRVHLTHEAQTASLLAQAAYLQSVAEIDFGTLALDTGETEALQNAFPNAQLRYTAVSLLGTDYFPGTTEIDLSAMTSNQVDTAIAELKSLKKLQKVNLLDSSGSAKLTLDDVVKLYTAFPGVEFTYAADLFGQRWTTDMQMLEYRRQNIGDAGLEEIRKMLPLMPDGFRLRMDNCKTTDDAMAQLREDFPNLEIHWRIYYAASDVMTDNYRLWTIGGLWDGQTDPLRHLREQRYIDLGHNNITHVDWMTELRDLDTLILSIGVLEDLSGIRNCTKLTYLELFSNPKLDDEDMQHLSGLTNMEYLNVSNMPLITNLSFTDNMTNLKKLWVVRTKITEEEAERVQALHPDCEVLYEPYGDPSDYGWHYYPDGTMVPRYALLQEQIGYKTDQVSRWPKGELREEITFASTGINPNGTPS